MWSFAPRQEASKTVMPRTPADSARQPPRLQVLLSVLFSLLARE